MSERYPKNELIKILPSNWMKGWVGIIDEEIEDEVRVELGKENDLLPSGRVKPLVELIIEDRESVKRVLNYIDDEMQENLYESQVYAQMPFMKKERKVIKEGDKQYFLISEADAPAITSQKRKVRILFPKERFLVKLEGNSDVLNIKLADEIIARLNFSVELKFPEETRKRESPTDALTSVIETAYSPFVKEAEALQEEMDELKKLYAEKKISEEDYQKRQSELQAKAMAISQKITGMSLGLTPQVAQPTSSARLCPSCGASVGNAKFCPECGAKIEEPKCKNCGAMLPKGAKFCPECGSPIG